MVRLAPALVIVLEFVRAEQAEDAHAFPCPRVRPGPGGGYARVEVAWNAELLADLEAVRQADGDPGSVNRVGERLRRILPAGWAQHELSIADAVQQQRPVEITLRGPVCARGSCWSWHRPEVAPGDRPGVGPRRAGRVVGGRRCGPGERTHRGDPARLPRRRPQLRPGPRRRPARLAVASSTPGRTG
ncbi:MAG: hypothetical protein IPO88_27535 [Nannocystis sp.]|uniref:hypothetical protein n=1 Tax=Nannocystis sp. TaxID=1962667 RepID=UPI002428A4A2|nr:hypothetical protein [Nannocystis sp.]MBK9757182.1 hypothetical protein [Nannocystis sp.]